MHRTEGPDYTTVAGKRRFKEAPAPATVVDKDIMNACQEEIALAVENAGIVLYTTGALDEAGGWGQLDAALLARIAASTATAHITADGKSHFDVVLNNTHRAGNGSDHSQVASLYSDMIALDNVVTPQAGSWSLDSNFSSIKQFGAGLDSMVAINLAIQGDLTVATATYLGINIASKIDSTAIKAEGLLRLEVSGAEETGIYDVNASGTILIKRQNGSSFPISNDIKIFGSFIGAVSV